MNASKERGDDVILNMHGGESHSRRKFSPMRVFPPLFFSSCKSVTRSPYPKWTHGIHLSRILVDYFFLNLISSWMNVCIQFNSRNSKGQVLLNAASLLDFLFENWIFPWFSPHDRWSLIFSKKMSYFLPRLGCILSANPRRILQD